MISRITAQNFGPLVDVDVELGKVTVFYGDNGAGKSSIVDAIRHVLSGKVTRGGVLKDLVRQGAKSFDVAIFDDQGFEFARHRALSGNPIATAGGVDLDEKAFATEIVGHLGADAATIDAALRSGALLDLEPATLLKLLTDLCRAKLDAAAIREQLGAAVVGAAEAQRLTLPGSLAEFPACHARAEAARQEAKRRRDGSKRALESLAPPAVEIPEGMTKLAVEKRLADLRAERDGLLRSQEAAAAYDAGAREQRLANLRARIAELQQVAAPHPDARVLPEAERMLAQSRTSLGMEERQVAAHAADRDALRKRTEGDRTLPAGADTVLERLRHAEAEVASGKTYVEAAMKEGKKRRVALDEAKKNGTQCCDACGQDVTLAHLQQRVDQAIEYHRTMKEALAEAEAAAAKLRAESAAVSAIRDRISAHLNAENLERLRAEAETRAEQLRQTVAQREAEVARLRPLAAQADAHRAAQADLQRVRAELAEVEAQRAPAAQAGSVASVEASIAKGEAFRAALDARALREAAAARVQIEEQAVAQTDLVTKALGPGGAQAELVARSMVPFLEEANAAFGKLAPDFALSIDADDFGFLVEQEGRGRCKPGALSDGDRTRLLYALQYAVARLADVPLVALDRTELLDDTGKAGMVRLMEACEADGIQVIAFSCRPAPAAAPPGKVVYVMRAGTATRVPGAVAGVAA
jgi:energy-coupling factor transporter ATP-binding protein EcfA2